MTRSQKRKTNEKQPKTEAADAADESPKIFNLIDDCCYKVLDYLSLKDLVSFGLTCKWAHQLAGNFLQMYYTTMSAQITRKGLTSTCFTPLKREEVSVEYFSKFIKKLNIKFRLLGPYPKITSFDCESVKEMKISYCTFWGYKIQYLQPILGKIERIELFCRIIGEFYEEILTNCYNLKQLEINIKENMSTLIGTSNDWMLRKYPTLEHLTIQIYGYNNVEGNSNIQSLGLDADTFMSNQSIFMSTTAKLNTLIIYINSIMNTDKVYELLNQLHDRGFYQQLIFSVKYNLDFSHLTTFMNLKEIHINSFIEKSDMDSIAKNLLNLERISIKCESLNHISPIIHHSPKLTSIRVINLFRIGLGFDLFTLNLEREKLNAARKVSIYLDERSYLTLKWTTKQTNFSLIDLKRLSSYKHDEKLYTIEYF